MPRPRECILISVFCAVLAGQQPSTCVIPIGPADVSQPKTVVGTGSPSSCTEQALAAAIAAGGVITFNCGPGPAVILLTHTHQFRNDMNSVVDGGNKVELRGNGTFRLFLARSADGPWYGGTPPFYKSTRTSVTFQNITISNGRSAGTVIPPPPPGSSPSCSQGVDLDGGGGMIFVRDMALHVFNSRMINNHGPTLGPDVAGGAIYALGSLDVVISGSTFEGNDASNGGAVGTLMSDATLVGNVFQNNHAIGRDGNYDIAASGCPIRYDQYQTGSGGSGGAVYFGGQATSRGIAICGNTFRGNSGGPGAMGGALWGAGDQGTQDLSISQSEFEGNQGHFGGAVYVYDSRTSLTQSTFSQNTGVIGGALQGDKTALKASNNTIFGNSGTTAVGAIGLFSGSAELRSNTFANNSGRGFPVLFTGDAQITPAPHVVESNVFVSNTTIGGKVPCRSGFSGTNNVLWPDSPGGSVPEAGCAQSVLRADPQLFPLGWNGGFTRTMAIPATSPAARISNACLATDQRGEVRAVPCSAGAYEPNATSSGCSFSFSKTMENLSADGGSGSVQLTTAPLCTWSAASNSTWAQIFPLSGTGSASLSYTVFPNFAAASRSAGILAGNAVLSISQAAATGSANERLVRLLYANFLGRLPSSSELALQAAALSAGANRTDVTLAFFNSTEFNLVGRFIAGAYIGLLARNPDFGGWLFQRNAMSKGLVSQSNLVANFLSSAEYRLAYGTPSDEEFVRLLYRNILFREPKASEVSFQVSNAVVPYGRAQTAMNLLNSVEFRNSTNARITTLLLYATLLQRNPDPVELAAGIAQVQSGGGRALIATIFLLPEYTSIF